jgi:hypothetical protein
MFDIFLNFFKIQIIETNYLDDPFAVAYHYLSTNFVADCIAVLPWANIKRQYIFIRYLKLIKFNIY